MVLEQVGTYSRGWQWRQKLATDSSEKRGSSVVRIELRSVRFLSLVFLGPGYIIYM